MIEHEVEGSSDLPSEHMLEVLVIELVDELLDKLVDKRFDELVDVDAEDEVVVVVAVVVVNVVGVVVTPVVDGDVVAVSGSVDSSVEPDPLPLKPEPLNALSEDVVVAVLSGVRVSTTAAVVDVVDWNVKIMSSVNVDISSVLVAVVELVLDVEVDVDVDVEVDVNVKLDFEVVMNVDVVLEVEREVDVEVVNSTSHVLHFTRHIFLRYRPTALNSVHRSEKNSPHSSWSSSPLQSPSSAAAVVGDVEEVDVLEIKVVISVDAAKVVDRGAGASIVVKSFVFVEGSSGAVPLPVVASIIVVVAVGVVDEM